MSKFNDWQKTKKTLNSAKAWIANREKVDSQDGGRYEKLEKQSISLEYCGQAYAGANNYHESPEEFNKYIAMAFNDFRVEIENRALEILQNECNKKSALAKGEVELMLEECSK